MKIYDHTINVIKLPKFEVKYLENSDVLMTKQFFYYFVA